MPRRSDKPKAAVEVNPQFANRPGVEVVEDRTSPVEVLPPGVTAVNSEAIAKALSELSELLRNGQQMTAQGMASVLRDASVRVVALRLLLGP